MPEVEGQKEIILVRIRCIWSGLTQFSFIVIFPFFFFCFCFALNQFIKMWEWAEECLQWLDQFWGLNKTSESWCHSLKLGDMEPHDMLDNVCFRVCRWNSLQDLFIWWVSLTWHLNKQIPLNLHFCLEILDSLTNVLS